MTGIVDVSPAEHSEADGKARSSGETERERNREEDRYEWEVESGEDEVEVEPDAYSWIDPSIVGTERLGMSASVLVPGLR